MSLRSLRLERAVFRRVAEKKKFLEGNIEAGSAALAQV